MGLDILLIRIVNEPIIETNWLPVEENPEIKSKYHEYLTERVLQFDDGTDLKGEGFYYEEISYQRKGVKSSFYKTYKPDEFLFTINELEELTKHIEKDYLRTFEEDFIKKFKEGDTVIFMGY